MNSVHADEEQTHQCKMCGTFIHGNAELRKHMATHHDARRFACGICAETFATQFRVFFGQCQKTGNKPVYATFVLEKKFSYF